MVTGPAYLVYGVTRAASPAALQALRAIEEQDLVVVRSGVLAAVVSAHLANAFEKADTPALHALAASYHRCVTQISAVMDLLPMQLGMMLPHAQAVRQYLLDQERTLVQQLDQIAGFQEWHLKLSVSNEDNAASAGADAKTYLRARKAARDQKRAAQASCEAHLGALTQRLLDNGARACRRSEARPKTLYVLWPRGAGQSLLGLLEAQAERMQAVQLDIHGPEAPFWFASEEGQRDAA